MLKEKIKKEFPGLLWREKEKKLVYLDSACSALKMKTAARAQYDFLLEYGTCAGNRSMHAPAGRAEERFYKNRSTVADFLGVSPEEIIFVSGSTEAGNLALSSVPFQKGDEIIISGLEHNAVFLPALRMAREKGLSLKIIPLKNFKPDYAAFAKMMNSRVKLVCVSSASNIFGGAIDTAPFFSLAGKYGALFFSDLAQSVPTHDLSPLGDKADLAAFSGHKLGAPFGIGVLFASRKAMGKMNSSKTGGGTIKRVFLEKGKPSAEFLPGKASFEAGLQNYSGAAGLAAAIDFLGEIGMNEVRKKVSGLASLAENELRKIKEIEVIGSGLEEGSLVSFRPLIKGFSPADFALYMSQGVPGLSFAFREGRMCADLACLSTETRGASRISFFVYTEPAEVEEFAAELRKYLRLLK